MKIAEVKAYPIAIPQKKRNGKTVPWVWGELSMVIVEVKTEDGLVGWGDAFAYGVTQATASVVNQTLRPHLIGEDARNIRQLTHKLFQKTHIQGRYGITTFAISGVEIALWDLAGKRANKPLHELLGGANSLEVPAYASLVRYPEEDERIAEDCTLALKEGYTMLKLHQVTESSVALAREAVGGEMPITVDVNCEWTPKKATQMAQAMSEYDLLWLEEPVWPPEDYDALADVQASSGVALASGENACTHYPFKQMMDAGAVTYVQPSVIKVGGIGEFMRVAQLAQTYGYDMAPHSPYFGPGFAATLHLIAHTGQADWIEKIYFDNEADPFIKPVEFNNGSYTVPDGPGLGVEVNPDVLKEYALKD